MIAAHAHAARHRRARNVCSGVTMVMFALGTVYSTIFMLAVVMAVIVAVYLFVGVFVSFVAVIVSALFGFAALAACQMGDQWRKLQFKHRPDRGVVDKAPEL